MHIFVKGLTPIFVKGEPHCKAQRKNQGADYTATNSNTNHFGVTHCELVWLSACRLGLSGMASLLWPRAGSPRGVIGAILSGFKD